MLQRRVAPCAEASLDSPNQGDPQVSKMQPRLPWWGWGVALGSIAAVVIS